MNKVHINNNGNSTRILILTGTDKEKALIENLLNEQQNTFSSFSQPNDFLVELSGGAALLILGKEVLRDDFLGNLKLFLSAQPHWSRIPIVILTDPNSLASSRKNFSFLDNVVLLEKPLHTKSFLSIIKSCLDDRLRQYEIRDLALSLKTAKEEADRANKTKNEFLSNMSHEIRTPLGAIIGFSELISQPRLTLEEREEYALIVKRNGQILSALVDDILDLTKVESGHLVIEESETVLDEVLSEVLSSLQFRSLLKDVPIFIEKAANIPSRIKTDPTRLKQILMNLIGNALKFTSEGQIKVKISLFHLSTENNQDYKLVFDITDTGVGISPEDHFKLFQAFFQADGSAARRFGGTGLGLALSRQLARALGGDIRLKHSSLGHGSTFQFSIRFVPVGKTSKLSSLKPKATSQEPLKGLKILVADDSLDNQTLLSRILTKEGALVETADNGEVAVAKALEDHFNVVIMDMQMPKLSGLEATAELRKQGYSHPILALSAFTMAEDQAKGLSAGCDLYLTKPVDKIKLVKVLQSYTH